MKYFWVFLKIVNKMALFQSFGKYPLFIQLLYIIVMYCSDVVVSFFNIKLDMLSGPEDFLGRHDFIVAETSSSEVNNWLSVGFKAEFSSLK